MNWQDIIPSKELGLIKWFYLTLLPESLENPLPFDSQSQKDRNLYKDWDSPKWINYYLDQPIALFEILSDFSDSAQFDESDDLVTVRDKFLKSLKELRKISEATHDEAKIESVKKKVITKLLPFKLKLMVGLNQLICLTKYHKPINVLIFDARDGKTDAIFELVKLDKSFIEMPEILTRIRIACIFNQQWFFDELGKNMRASVSRSELKNCIDDMTLVLLYLLGFYETPVEQFNSFLRKIGLDKYKYSSSLQRRLNRLGLKKELFKV